MDTYRRELATLERKASVLLFSVEHGTKGEEPKEAYQDNWDTDRQVIERETYGYTE